MNIIDDESEKGRMSKLKLWVKRLGIAGFFFFLIKGLIWLFFFLFVLGSGEG